MKHLAVSQRDDCVQTVMEPVSSGARGNLDDTETVFTPFSGHQRPEL